MRKEVCQKVDLMINFKDVWSGVMAARLPSTSVYSRAAWNEKYLSFVLLLSKYLYLHFWVTVFRVA